MKWKQRSLVRKSPLLIESLKSDKKMGRSKIMKISAKKLRKIKDPECLLYRTVLINNTVDLLKSHKTNTDTKLPDSYGQFNEDYQNCSKYSPEEEMILNSIQLPDLITPISDRTLDDHVKGDHYRVTEKNHEHNNSLTEDKEDISKDQISSQDVRTSIPDPSLYNSVLSKQFSCLDNSIAYSLSSYLIAAK